MLHYRSITPDKFPRFRCVCYYKVFFITKTILVPIDVLVKKDKKESSKSTLKLRKEKKEKVFGAISSTEDHLTKLKPLLERIKQVGKHFI